MWFRGKGLWLTSVHCTCVVAGGCRSYPHCMKHLSSFSAPGLHVTHYDTQMEFMLMFYLRLGSISVSPTDTRGVMNQHSTMGGMHSGPSGNAGIILGCCFCCCTAESKGGTPVFIRFHPFILRFQGIPRKLKSRFSGHHQIRSQEQK